MQMKLCLSVTLAMLIAIAGVTAAEAADPSRFVIQGPEQVIDGWVSRIGKREMKSGSSFDSAQVLSYGREWSEYTRCLLKFDLSEIAPSRYGRVKRATLRLEAIEATNDDKLVTTVAAADVPWTAEATWVVTDGTATWPKIGPLSNIDYAMCSAGSSSQVITGPGTVSFDVTDMVDDWLYGGLGNHGVIIRTGVFVDRSIALGNFRLVFASTEATEHPTPTLVIEMTGQPPTPEEAADRALKIYPSALLPPVKSPYLFLWYEQADGGLSYRLDTPNAHIANASLGGQENPRGILSLTSTFGPQPPDHQSAEAWLSHYGTPAGGHLGLAIDGWQSLDRHPEQADWARGALREAEARYPQTFSAVYWRGEADLLELAEESLPDLLIFEGYSHLRKKFNPDWAIGIASALKQIEPARPVGMLEQTIIMLGQIAQADDYAPGNVLTAQIIDAQLRTIRESAPEMPGVGFYYVRGEELAAACDALTHAHFIAPAPDVAILAPAFESVLTTEHVRIQATATAQGDRSVDKYRWFIDNRLVAETAQPTYLWDLRGEATGYHFLTVHAVDSGYNRAAAQTLVKVAR